MRIAGLLLGFLLAACTFSGYSQGNVEVKQPRILLLLDGSSSMLQPWEAGEERFKTASRIITTLIDSIYKVNSDVEFALRVYGHQYPAQDKNCFDTKREVMFSKDNLTQMMLRLESLHPMGVSPIAYSLKEAAETELIDNLRYNYSLILITDGGESCGGNICDVVKTLLDKKINFKPYIVSLVDYAPLQDQYACLGNYILATKEKDIPVAVGKIVEAYRPMLKMLPVDKNDIPSVVVNTPAITKVPVPKVEIKKEPEPVKEQEIPKLTTQPVSKPAQVSPAPVTARPVETIPLARPKEEVSFIRAGEVRLRRPEYAPPVASRVRVPQVNLKDPAPDPVPVVASTPPVQQPPKTEPAVTPKPPVSAPKPIAKPPAPALSIKTKEAKYTVEREEQKETTLEVFFTDGKGKFYQTTPQIILLDPKTGAPTHKFYRTVNASGSPDPQKMPTGVYDLTVAGKSNLLVRNVEVRPNNKNKILIQVGKASLRFRYEDDPAQPVKEYVAKVKKNFEPGPVITQLGTQELEYEPGNYHIILNQTPVRHESVDLEFDAIIVVTVQKPGYVQFLNTNNLGKVSMYFQLGDQYVPFGTLNISGNPAAQKLELRRGNYKVGYNKTPNMPYAQETFKFFNVKSKETTEIELN